MKVRSLLLSIVFSCCCSAEDPSDPPDPPDPPLIRLNSDFLPNRTEVVLEAGSGFNLSCHGDLSVRWSTTAFNLLYNSQQLDPLVVKKSDPKHTGTYRCGYTNRSLEHLDTWIHLYVTDPADPSSVFVTTYRRSYYLKEGQDFLFKCLLTDPSVTNLTLQSEDSTGSLPQGMNVTFDPWRGALIRDLQPSFNGRYVCSGWKDGRQFRSKAVSLQVDRRLRPPRLAVSEDEVVRLEGETFKVTCLTSNPSHLYMVTWTHPHLKTLNVINHQEWRSSRLHIDSTLTVSNVSRTHGGTYTCTAINEDGVATATTHLTVLDGPYLRIYLQLTNANTKPIEVFEDPAANVSSVGMEVQGELEANVSSGSLKVYGELIVNVSTDRKDGDGDGDGDADVSGSSTVEVYEGRDVRLTFVMEAYPPIRNQHWTTTAQVHNDNNVTVYQESYAANGYRSEAILQLWRVRQEDRGRYSFHFDNSFFNGSQNIDLRVYRSPSVVVRLENDTLTCSSSGYPLPTILWNSCPGVRETCFNDVDLNVAHLPPAAVTSQEEEVRSHLTLPVSSGDDVTVECISYSQMGMSQEVFHPRNQQSVLTPALIGSLSVAAVLLLLLLVVFYQWRQKPRYEIRWKIIESTDGNNYTFVDPTQLPYNHEWEFPRDKLRLGAVVGSGAFGKVVEATAYGLGTNNVTRVAVKMLKPSAHSEEREALMSELKILGHLGYHDNIVNLLGACTRGGPMLMITEYCSHGDLLNFLRARAQDFMACVVSVDEVEGEAFYKNTAAQNARLRSDSGISCSSDYQEMQPVLSPGQTHQGVQTNRVSVTDLMRFSYQVAQGLDFLSTRNCIHRDVAARNVLLTDRRVAKICDFGLARDIRNDDSYIVQGNARLPVKWMAPESIFQCVYTVQSDVWSYGVLLWETFSLGKSPYPNVAVDTNFYKMIQDGRHMDQPDFAPAEMYELMTLCWSLEPTDRPTFKMIGQLIDRLLPSTNDTWPNHSDQSTYKNIDECREEEEEEEGRGGGGALKRGEEEECSQRERHDDDHDDTDDEEEEKPMMKNIYQLS